MNDLEQVIKELLPYVHGVDAQKGEVWINTNTEGKDGYAVMTGCPTLANLLHAEMSKFNEEVK